MITFVGVLAILHWRSGNFESAALLSKLEPSRITFSHGVSGDWQFVFFLKHLGLFPLAPPASIIRHDPQRHRDVLNIARDTPEEAQRLLRLDPVGLRMDEGLTWRSGGFGRVYLYLYDSMIHPDHVDAPTVRPANEMAFNLSLVLLWIAFCSVWRPLIGASLVALVGSNPLQNYSIYGEDNIFSWNITTMIVLLALHIPLIFSRDGLSDTGVRVRRLLWVPIVSAVFLSLVRTVRSEPVILAASALLVYASMRGTPLRIKATFVITFVTLLTLLNQATHALFEAKIARTREVVESVGGVPFPASKPIDHELWHPIWCGLGDFDTTYNRAFDDRAAFRAALPQLERQTGRRLDLDPSAWEQPNYPLERTRRYFMVFGDFPGYDQAIRALLIEQMRKNPWWYPRILMKRIKAIVENTTPLTLIADGHHEARVSNRHGIAAIGFLIVALLLKKREYAVLILFTVPLSATALIITSGGGLTSYSLYHVFGIVVGVALIAESLLNFARAIVAQRKSARAHATP